MRRICVKFVLAVGIPALLFSGAILRETWTSGRHYMEELTASQAELALEFDLAIREYISETVRPEMEKHVCDDDFQPETMSTSFVARNVFEKVRRRFPQYKIKFSSDDPRNPVNLAGPEEREMIQYFRDNPEEERWVGRIQLEGVEYLAHFSPRRMKESCLRCHGRPENAPQSLIARYGNEGGFHKEVGDIMALDTIAIPTQHVESAMATMARSHLAMSAMWLGLLLLSVFLAFRFLVARRLGAMSRRIQQAASGEESLTPILDEAKGKDEISILATSFNKLTKRLRGFHKEMEQLVRQRTVELESEIDERIRMEKALRESESLFRTMASSAQDAIMMMDQDGKITFWNRAAFKIFGYVEQEVLGKNLHEILAATQDREEFAKALPHFQKTGRGRVVGKTVELMAVNRGGHKVPIELSLASVQRNGHWHAVGIARDISERRLAEQSLRAERDKAQRYLDIAGVMLVGLDRQGKIRLLNRRAYQLLGYENGELEGRDWFATCLPKDQIQETRKLHRQIINGQQVSAEYWENPVLTKDGEMRMIAWHNTVLRDDTGDIVGTLSSGEDVSERHKMERELRQKEDELRQSQKMEAVGCLAGGIAHEFNNLLQSIRGYTQLAMEELPCESQIHEDLNQVVSSTDRAAKLVRQLLDFSRRSTPNVQEADPNEVVSEMVAMLRPLIGERIKLEIALDDSLEKLNADATMLEQMLLNLCVNARDAMPKGGRLLIRTESFYVDSKYAEYHPDLKTGSYVRISVSDTGCGMPPAVADRIFEPFYTTKEVGKGTGMGLATVYAVVQQHHGAVNVYSEVGKGTTFRVYLPFQISDDDLPTSQVTPPHGNENILIAEDDPQIRNMANRILQQAGYTPITAEDGEEAVKLMDEHGESISLALLDVVMPKLSGHEVARRIRRLRPGMPIVFCTGYDPAAGTIKEATESVGPLIEKPFDPPVLLQTIRSALDQAATGQTGA